MDHYYVNNNDQPSGEHEVHKEDCSFLKIANSKKYLGYYSNCKDAVKKAKETYTNVDGCYYCCNACHTK